MFNDEKPQIPVFTRTSFADCTDKISHRGHRGHRENKEKGRVGVFLNKVGLSGGALNNYRVRQD
jgi:hypothetical protein